MKSSSETISPETAPEPPRDRAFYLNLIKLQFQRIRDMGFLGSVAVESMDGSPLEHLDIDTLKAIARGAGLLLRAEHLPPD